MGASMHPGRIQLALELRQGALKVTLREEKGID
jgi:hypothetical protein